MMSFVFMRSAQAWAGLAHRLTESGAARSPLEDTGTPAHRAAGGGPVLSGGGG